MLAATTFGSPTTADLGAVPIALIFVSSILIPPAKTLSGPNWIATRTLPLQKKLQADFSLKLLAWIFGTTILCLPDRMIAFIFE